MVVTVDGKSTFVRAWQPTKAKLPIRVMPTENLTSLMRLHIRKARSETAVTGYVTLLTVMLAGTSTLPTEYCEMQALCPDPKLAEAPWI